MQSDDHFTEWAALFISAYNECNSLAGQPVARVGGVQYNGLTPAAVELLRAIEAGGVPAFVTSHLKQIARDNGIEVTIEWTPNQIIEAIRGKASQGVAEKPELDR